MDAVPQAQPSPPLSETLAEERAAAREQLTAAWQLHVAHIEEQLSSSGWREDIERVCEERFAQLAARLTKELELSIQNARRQARHEASEEFSQAARRLRQCENKEQWAAALLDLAAPLAGRAAVFLVAGQALKGLCGHAAEIRGVEIRIDAAPAFARAIQSQDTVVVMRTAEELPESVMAIFGEAPEARAFLFPVAARNRVVAVLYAEGDDATDVSGLELLAALGAAALESHAGVLQGRAPDLAAMAVQEAEGWTSFPRQEQELHLRARRFARVQVAEMRLYKSRAVRAGRARCTLYAELKEDIDSAREAFRRQFLSASPSMPDDFHLELVGTLANDDVAALGEDYPGPLV
jgi:hypothetical protein